ncbi:MAG: adenine-specific methyltransferase EcoRI family protein, partial [Candidatus Cloacimonetes bacterium]|nr:adenine-specific methyltransferase EcoRI family protein [Candidatus Cloacimonadota bacterium]
MEQNGKNKQLHKAKKDKQDEFYTQLSDIEKELKHYKNHFKDKVVFCNCDDPQESNFVVYFCLNFKQLGLKKLISTHYDSKKPTYKLEYDGVEFKELPLKENGDFRSLECIELLKEADVVITNPPFSLFREYVAQLVEYEKKFLIIGNMNAITYKEIFSMIKENKIWLGCSIHSGDREFRVPDHYIIHSASKRVDENGLQYVRVVGIRWFTNLDYKERHEDIVLYKKYNPTDYPKYDNYDAINVDKTKDIPVDYEGKMGVPITFMDKYNPGQFEIVGRMTTTKIDEFNHGYPYINGKK